jgi:hypothetical protein
MRLSVVMLNVVSPILPAQPISLKLDFHVSGEQISAERGEPVPVSVFRQRRQVPFQL